MPVNLSPEKNYYKILGVAQKANLKTIKKKFRELARKHHPDANKGSKKSEEVFKQISEAYEVLGDSKKRKAYDSLRAGGSGRGRGFSGNPSQPGSGFGQGFDDTWDFGKKYGRQQSDPREDPFAQQGRPEEPEFDPDLPTRGFDLQFMVDVPFVTACLGGKIPYSYERHATCPECKGQGKTEEYETCAQCEGSTRIIEQVTKEVEIPQGIPDKYTLRIPLEGGAGRNGGPPGDLLIKVCIPTHPRFKRVKNDVYAEVLLSQKLAEEGGWLTVETLQSPETIQIEEGTLTGEDMRLSGKGAYEPWGKKRGDLVFKFRIKDS